MFHKLTSTHRTILKRFQFTWNLHLTTRSFRVEKKNTTLSFAKQITLLAVDLYSRNYFTPQIESKLARYVYAIPWRKTARDMSTFDDFYYPVDDVQKTW